MRVVDFTSSDPFSHEIAQDIFLLTCSPSLRLPRYFFSSLVQVGVQDMVRQDDRFDHISGKIFKGLQSAFEQVRCCVVVKPDAQERHRWKPKKT